MSKNVTEFGKAIADILRDTPRSLQDLQSLIDWYFNFPGDLTPPTTVEDYQDRHRMARLLVSCMRDKAEQIQADLERLEMVCDEMQEGGRC